MDDTLFVPRLLSPPDRSFFLFGPRGTGKSTWLRQTMPEALYLDLLDASLSLELSVDPHRLEALATPVAPGGWIILDEVQKIPPILDEVHRLLSGRRLRFALCGSSARKLRRGGVNLLAGRAITRSMEGFSGSELGKGYDPHFSLQWGTLPFVWADARAAAHILSAYVSTYLKEEIRQEGLVRLTAPFVRFLSIAGQLNGQVVNALNISRDSGVPRSTVDTYFSILLDTLVGHFLPAWRPEAKVRERAHPKFYWFDPGVARAAAGLLRDAPDRTWLGTSLETLVYHELRVYNEVSGKMRPIFYYRTPAGVEIDFVVETGKRQAARKPRVILIEVKLAEKWDRRWGKSMVELAAHQTLHVDRMIGVYLGTRRYDFDGVVILPIVSFINELFEGSIY